MTGTWKGYYKYNNVRYQQLIGFDQTYFQINILTFDGTRFTGTVEDDRTTGGMEGIGKIEGTLDGQQLEFIKSMPILTSLGKNKGELITRNMKHPPIIYRGSLSENNTNAEGSWNFKNWFYWYGIIPLPHIKLRGTWQMSQV